MVPFTVIVNPLAPRKLNVQEHLRYLHKLVSYKTRLMFLSSPPFHLHGLASVYWGVRVRPYWSPTIEYGVPHVRQHTSRPGGCRGPDVPLQDCGRLAPTVQVRRATAEQPDLSRVLAVTCLTAAHFKGHHQAHNVVGSVADTAQYVVMPIK